MNEILSVKDLVVHFNTQNETIYAVNGISYTLHEGETIGIVGESGSGKTVSSMSILRMIDIPPGNICNGEALYNGKDLIQFSEREMRKIRGKEIGVIFQDPMAAFNPVMRIGDQIVEGLIEHTGISKKEALLKAEHFLEIVGISSPKERLKNYPSQFSGGMLQRAMIAMGLICDPKILIADEPTTALDVTVQAQIIDLIKELRKEFNTSILWITHDLGIIAGIADTVLVMYAGYIVEEAPVDCLYAHPRHPYTKGLIESLPTIEDEGRKRLDSIKGLPPFMNSLPKGCPFAPRCKYVEERCLQENPLLIEKDSLNGHKVACWLDL